MKHNLHSLRHLFSAILLLALLGLPGVGWGLTAGDIAIIAVHTDASKTVTFVALSEIPSNTSISLTDNSWDATSQSWRTGEGTIVWSHTAVVTAGTVITLSVNASPFSSTIGSVTTNTNFNLSTSGDQVLAYEGTSAPTTNTSTTWLYGFSTRNFAYGNNANSSDIPTALSIASVAMTTNTTDFDNAYFANGTTAQSAVSVSGTKTELLVLFNDASKYYKDNNVLTLPTYTITVNSSATLTPPTLTAASGATVDAPFNVTFTDDATWRAAITSIKVGATTLTAGSSVSAGQITFTPSASVPAALLQTAGSPTITVVATGYTDATVVQAIGAGAATKLAMVTQPTAPATNGGALATQPVVRIQDQYSNTTTSTASVTAAVGAGTWTLGGTTSVAGIAGTVTYSGLTATSSAAVTGATIAFTSDGLLGVTSGTFNIPAPVITLTAAVGATVDAPFDVTFTDNPTWRAAITSITVGGTTLTAGWVVSAGKITFTPSASVPATLLQTSSTKSIVVIATGYSNATVSQVIGAGVATKLGITTPPTAPATNGGVLATQPVVRIQDQYSNTTTSTAAVVAAPVQGTWTLGGTTSVAGIAGTVTYSGLTANSAAAVTGATITFTSGSFAGVTSGTFNIPAPAPANDNCAGAIAITCGNSVTVDNTSATDDVLPGVSCGINSVGYFKGTWYTVTPAASGSVTVSACSSASTRDTYLRIYSGTCGSFTACVGFDDDACGTTAGPSQYTFAATGNTTYYILVGMYEAISTPGSITISATCPLVAPVATSANPIESTSFTANWNASAGATGGYKLDVSSTAFSFATTTETFTAIAGGTTSSYLTRTWTGVDGITWTSYKTRTDQTIFSGNEAICLRDEAGAYLVSGEITGSPSNITFDIQQKFTGSGGNVIIKILSGTGFSTVTTLGTYPFSTTASVINVPVVGIVGPFKVQIENDNTNARPCIDNLAITRDSFTSVGVFSNYSVVGTFQSVGSLTPNTTYYYRVRGTDGTNVSGNSNEISVTTPLPVYNLLGADDVTANYSSWINSSNEGCGFGAWSLSSGGNAGFFPGDPSVAGIIGLPNPSFGIYANTTNADYANADRPFVAPLSIGSTMSVTWGVNWDANGSGNKGINLYTGGTSGTQIININMGNSAVITINSDAMFNNYGNSAMTINFEYVSSGNLRVYGTGRDGSEAYDQTIAVSGAPDAIRFYASELNTGDQRQPYFNNLKIVTDPSAIPAVSSVFVKGCVQLAEDFEVEDLTIESGNTLQVNAGFDLTVNGSLTNEAGASALVLNSDATGTGSLIHNTAGVEATVERHIVGHGNVSAAGWHLLSSPVASFSIDGSAFDPGTTDDLYSWSESTKTWLNHKSGNPSQIDAGIGYLASYETTAATPRTFTGLLNTANLTFSGLANTTATNYSGWHLLGNPFASAIDYDLGSWAKTNIDVEIQVWNSIDASYKTSTEVSGVIPSMNGFMVHTTGEGSITIPANARVHNPANWYKSHEEFILLKANDLQNATSQSSIVRFNPTATEAYDRDFDSYFMSGFAPMFYSVSGSDLYALNTLPEVSNSLVIPFGFVKNASTNYNIELAKNISGAIVYLTDKKTSTVTNLSLSPVYTFTASEGDDVNRFILHFGSVGITNPATSSSISVYTHGETLYIGGLEAKAEISVINLTGQVVMSSRTNGSGLHTLNAASLAKGVYLVSVISNGQAISRKVVL